MEKGHLRVNTILLSIITLCLPIIGYFGKQVVDDVKKNGDDLRKNGELLIEVHTNQRSVMDDVRELKKTQGQQDMRLDRVEVKVENLEKVIK